MRVREISDLISEKLNASGVVVAQKIAFELGAC